jgi:outer membrane receptor protein involved in Fe transport
VNATRTVVTPSLNQFDVPATAIGANAIVRVPFSPTVTLETGADIRHADGATNEDATFIANAFTRRRHAGGEQTVGGVFAELNWLPVPELTLTAGARGDYWQQADGTRVETVIATGAGVRNDTYPSKDGTVGNYRLGARYEVADGFALRAVTYSGFRVPTLNELYRPFRVGNDITEANPSLIPERVYGVEGGFVWTSDTGFSLSANYFHNWLNNAVGNITVQTTPGLNTALNVVVPAGGVLRQRQNVDRIEADGVELSAALRISDGFSVSADYLYTNPRVTRAAAQPTLQGLRLAEVARHQASLSAVYRPTADWTLRVDGRVASNLYDDDQNTRLLKGYFAMDAYADYAITSYATVFISGENITDKTVEAGKSADGLITVGNPQVFSGGVRFRF